MCFDTHCCSIGCCDARAVSLEHTECRTEASRQLVAWLCRSRTSLHFGVRVGSRSCSTSRAPCSLGTSCRTTDKGCDVLATAAGSSLEQALASARPPSEHCRRWAPAASVLGAHHMPNCTRHQGDLQDQRARAESARRAGHRRVPLHAARREHQ